MIKKAQFGDQIQDHNRGELRRYPEELLVGFREKIGKVGVLRAQ
jgi:hypothetical protein